MTSTNVNKNESKRDAAMIAVPDDVRTTVLQSDLGRTHISQDVVAKIAGLAVREIEGVHALVPFGAGQRLSSLARSIGGSDMKDLGVAVEVGEIEAAVDCRIVTEYGVSIPRVAAAIQANVGERIREMTGLKVKEVNIEVVDLYFEEEQTRAADASPRVK